MGYIVGYDSLMMDLETMGMSHRAAVVQIALVPFNIHNERVAPEEECFFHDVVLESSIALGGEVDDPTQAWWAARGGFRPEGEPRDMLDVLRDLSAYVRRCRGVQRVWSQGAGFDCAIMEGYFTRSGERCPWKFRETRDTRTVYDMAGILARWQKPRNIPVSHQAREDCLGQIADVLAAFGALRASGARP